MMEKGSQDQNKGFCQSFKMAGHIQLGDFW